MKISIFGLGYVGCVSLGCHAELGYKLIGVDVNQPKVDLINQGIATIQEAKIDDLIKKHREAKNIEATTDVHYAINNTDISFICVGTPSSERGHLDLTYIFGVCKEIGEALKNKDGFHVVVIRSTVFPGTNEKAGKIIEEASGKIRGTDFAMVSNPEFLREATAVDDFFQPELTVIGCDHPKAKEMMFDINSKIDTTVYDTEINVAEMIKYVNNSFHALKVSFANEVGRVCKSKGIDSHEVMRIFCADKKLNISPYYFKPGFAYGGSCLPKDLKALKTMSHDQYLHTPIIDSIDSSNQFHISGAWNQINSYGKKRIAFMGLSFKAGTDDLRNSPTVELIERFLGKGYDISIFDEEVSLSKLIGKNKEYIAGSIPHLDKILKTSREECIENAEIIVITKKDADLLKLKEQMKDKIIIDFVRIKELENMDNYQGLCW